jgi:hypothetical protein
MSTAALSQQCREYFERAGGRGIAGRKDGVAELLGVLWSALNCEPAFALTPTPMAMGTVVATTTGGARSAANAARVARQLASEEQVSQLLRGAGRVLAGPGAKVPLRDAARLARENWIKVTSTSRFGFQTHAYRNIVTGQVVELKTKFLLWW